MENLYRNEIFSLIQARMSSSRLKGKVLFPLGSSTILGQLIDRAKLFSSKVIVCTSKNKDDNPIEEYCKKSNTECFRGSLNNVFSRFQEAIINKNLKKINWFARLTGDNPLTSVELANLLISNISEDLDYLSFNKDLIPIGTGLELINKQTFLKIKNEELDLQEREHVTLKLYEKNGPYNCKIIDPPLEYRYPEIRLTVDYKEDYILLKKLFSFNKDITLKYIIDFYNNNKNIFEVNKHCVQKKAR